jgi:hypothetical protein
MKAKPKHDTILMTPLARIHWRDDKYNPFTTLFQHGDSIHAHRDREFFTDGDGNVVGTRWEMPASHVARWLTNLSPGNQVTPLDPTPLKPFTRYRVLELPARGAKRSDGTVSITEFLKSFGITDKQTLEAYIAQNTRDGESKYATLCRCFGAPNADLVMRRLDCGLILRFPGLRLPGAAR